MQALILGTFFYVDVVNLLIKYSWKAILLSFPPTGEKIQAQSLGKLLKLLRVCRNGLKPRMLLIGR